MLTVGTLRRLTADLPDDAPVFPTWADDPPDAQAGIAIRGFGIRRRTRTEPVGLSVAVALDAEDEDADADAAAPPAPRASPKAAPNFTATVSPPPTGGSARWSSGVWRDPDNLE